MFLPSHLHTGSSSDQKGPAPTGSATLVRTGLEPPKSVATTLQHLPKPQEVFPNVLSGREYWYLLLRCPLLFLCIPPDLPPLADLVEVRLSIVRVLLTEQHHIRLEINQQRFFSLLKIQKNIPGSYLSNLDSRPYSVQTCVTVFEKKR